MTDTQIRFRRDPDLLRQWGADAYVQKMDGPTVLLKTVNALLGQARKS